MDAAAVAPAPVIKRQRKARAVPKVRVYSRHRSECKWAGDDTRIGCDCPKQLTWFRDGKLHRVAADSCDGEVAEKKARALMNGFEAAAKGEPTPIPAGALTTLIDDAVKTFLDTKAASGVTAKHTAKLKFELEHFSQFVLGKGLVNLGDLKTEHVVAYRNSLTGAQNTRAKKVFRLIGFFRFCVEMGWIQRNIAQAQAVKLKYDDTQTPKALIDAQFETLLAAVQKVNGRTTDDQRRKLRGLLLLMRWSGLSIRDAVCIERARFDRKDTHTALFLHRAKTSHPVYAILRNEIVDEVFALANPGGRYLFVESVPQDEHDLDLLVQGWGNLFRKLGLLADLRDDHDQPLHFTSHSMRHTFVFWALNAGLPTEDIAALIGDSVEIVARHYSAWIAGRQERLSERMMQALK
jgi:integrase/recombinase XerD